MQVGAQPIIADKAHQQKPKEKNMKTDNDKMMIRALRESGKLSKRNRAAHSVKRHERDTQILEDRRSARRFIEEELIMSGYVPVDDRQGQFITV